MTAPKGDGPDKPRKYPPGTVAIWVAVSAIGLWLVGSGVIGILSGS